MTMMDLNIAQQIGGSSWRFLGIETPLPCCLHEYDTSVVAVKASKKSSRICKYWIDGNCAYGDQCWNRHSFVNVIKKDSPRPKRLVWWTAPPIMFVKINCDGAFTRCGNKAAAGGIVRDWKANFVYAFSSRLGKCCTALEAELWAIKIGVETAVSRVYGNLIVESDSYASIQLINMGVPQGHIFYDLVSSILEIGNKANHIVWNHVFRETNSTADGLAKHGLSLSSGIELFEFPPPFIWAPLCADEMGVIYSR
ncbi:putative ribonuclease H protein [Glycine soja]